MITYAYFDFVQWTKKQIINCSNGLVRKSSTVIDLFLFDEEIWTFWVGASLSLRYLNNRVKMDNSRLHKTDLGFWERSKPEMMRLDMYQCQAFSLLWILNLVFVKRLKSMSKATDWSDEEIHKFLLKQKLLTHIFQTNKGFCLVLW